MVKATIVKNLFRVSYFGSSFWKLNLSINALLLYGECHGHYVYIIGLLWVSVFEVIVNSRKTLLCR